MADGSSIAIIAGDWVKTPVPGGPGARMRRAFAREVAASVWATAMSPDCAHMPFATSLTQVDVKVQPVAAPSGPRPRPTDAVFLMLSFNREITVEQLGASLGEFLEQAGLDVSNGAAFEAHSEDSADEESQERWSYAAGKFAESMEADDEAGEVYFTLGSGR